MLLRRPVHELPRPVRSLTALEVGQQPVDELGRVTQQRGLVSKLLLELAQRMNEPPLASAASTSLPAFCLPIFSASRRKVARSASTAPSVPSMLACMALGSTDRPHRHLAQCMHC